MIRFGTTTDSKTKSRKRAPSTLSPPQNSKTEDLLSWLCLALIYVFMLSRFDLRLIASDSILTGGDSASWYQVLQTLKEDFLPKGRFFGFSQGNFFGYLEGQHYFVLPFLAAALLGFLLPLTVALKIATIAGGFALPLTMFISASSISGRKRSGAIAAATSLLFLFNESYSIFGGNWLSTFAGEFCYSWAIALLPLLIASLFRDWRKRRKGLLSGLILALIGLCHFFVFMPAFFLPLFPAFSLIPRLWRKKPKNSRSNPGLGPESGVIARVLSTYFGALLVMAFWLMPMAATRDWAQPISMLWQFNSFKDFASQTLLGIWAPSAALFLLLASMRKNTPLQRRLAAFLFYALGACAFLFFIAPGLGMPDIRFVPPALLICGLGLSLFLDAAAEGFKKKLLPSLGRSARRPGGKAGWIAPLLTLIPLLSLGASVAASLALSRNAPGWFSWNYSGYETKTEWPFIRFIGQRYKGSPDEGRFLWEKQDQRDNRDFGSERAFENLSLFTGHPSSEGIHYGSSMMARAATYLQSSYSPNPVDPEAERIYSTIDPESWPARFDLLNARYIITHSETIGSLFASHPDFAPDASMGKFSIFRYRRYTDSYVSLLPIEAISLVEEGGGGFKTDYYRFFRDYELYRQPFVSSRFVDRELEARLSDAGGNWPDYDSFRNVAMAKKALEDQGALWLGDNSASVASRAPDRSIESSAAGSAESVDTSGSPVISDERVDNFSIRFRTTAPGEPHYIKISYAPGWRSSGGETIYPVSPGFMLLFPTSVEVELSYCRTVWEILGIALSLMAIPFAIIIGKKKPKRSFGWRVPLVTGLGV
ncbi:MAG: 6-pyruvoyl-tetrahydropterin synthase-related protein, partial [Spirochaetales bacterium]|nr:6-pyruvoyl-tetrahydropterin synthase-related protein [Spirochaetales bacterium]